jgi:hypothetical protein
MVYAQFNSVMSDGGDLAGKGLVDYGWDAVYIIWFVLCMAVFTNWIWLLSLSLPIFAGWKLWTSLIQPALAMRSMSKSLVEGNGATPAGKGKRATKGGTSQQKERVKYVKR